MGNYSQHKNVIYPSKDHFLHLIEEQLHFYTGSITIKPQNHLPDDYKLMTVFDLDKSKKAKGIMLASACLVFFIVGSLFFIHLNTIFIQLFEDPLNYAFIIWISGLILSPIVATIGYYLLERQVFIHLTGEKPTIVSDRFYIYFSNADWYFSRKHTLQILLYPQTIMVLTILGIIPFTPSYVVSILLLTLAVTLACSVADLLLASYLWQFPSNTIIRLDRSRFEIYRYKKIALPAKDSIVLEKKDVLKTAVSLQPFTKDNLLIDENKLKEKELAKFHLDINN